MRLTHDVVNDEKYTHSLHSVTWIFCGENEGDVPAFSTFAPVTSLDLRQLSRAVFRIRVCEIRGRRGEISPY